jgi:c(7)-type cytochrome triheme protein
MEPIMIAKLILTFAASLVLAAAPVMADDLPRLPAARKLPQTGDSPGVVTFDHEMHVDPAKPACLSCHPRLFSILGRSAATRERTIRHAAMEKGEACGACHGKHAFGFEDCTMCHAK